MTITTTNLTLVELHRVTETPTALMHEITLALRTDTEEAIAGARATAVVEDGARQVARRSFLEALARTWGVPLPTQPERLAHVMEHGYSSPWAEALPFAKALVANKGGEQHAMPLVLNPEAQADFAQQFADRSRYAVEYAADRLTTLLKVLVGHVGGVESGRLSREHQTKGVSGLPTDVLMIDHVPVWSGGWMFGGSAIVWHEDFTSAWPEGLVKP